MYFQAGTQLGPEFCEVNNLVRKTDPVTGKNIGGYLEKNRCVRAINLRKSKSDGLCLKLECLSEFTDIQNLKAGDKIEVLNGKQIACKYIPLTTHKAEWAGGNGRRPKGKEETAASAPKVLFFREHIETEHLDRNLDNFRENDLIQITLKLDGTSQRTGYLPKRVPSKLNKLRQMFGKEPIFYTKWEYITGTRHTVLKSEKGGFYGNNLFRIEMEKKFQGKLHKGEEVFYEIVGYTGNGGVPIRPIVANSKLNDKEFVNKYGAVTEFNYGCDRNGDYDTDPPCCEVYVYRMTMTNEDGISMEYSPAQIKRRCQEMGVKYVPEFKTLRIPAVEEDGKNPGEFVMWWAKAYYDGPDPVGNFTHIREGVVVRNLSRSNFAAYKLKNHNYKVLAGIAVAQLEESGQINELEQDMIEEL